MIFASIVIGKKENLLLICVKSTDFFKTTVKLGNFENETTILQRVSNNQFDSMTKGEKTS